jgi:RNA polymerase sigma-70 factor (ECF subfamily)
VWHLGLVVLSVPDDDPTLLAAWGEGDAAAGNRLLERHFGSVFRFFRSKLDVQVDELVQRTFEACLESRASYRGEAAFKAWLMGIARNQLLRYLQREHCRGPEPLDPMRTTIVEALDRESPSVVAAEREEQRILLRALLEIPIDLQIAIELHYWEEMTVVEIAGVLDVPTGTVKSRLRRGRTLLRDAIDRVAATPDLAERTGRDLDRWAASLRARLLASD